MHVEAMVVSVGRVALVVTTGVALLVHPSVLSFAVAQARHRRRPRAGCVVVVPGLLAGVAAFASAARDRHRRAAFCRSGLLSYVFFRIDTLLLRAFGIADVAIGAYSAAYRVMEAPEPRPVRSREA